MASLGPRLPRNCCWTAAAASLSTFHISGVGSSQVIGTREMPLQEKAFLNKFLFIWLKRKAGGYLFLSSLIYTPSPLALGIVEITRQWCFQKTVLIVLQSK
jgi:hypothetical protein